MRKCAMVLGYLRDASWPDALKLGAAECDERFAAGKAAMYLTGIWSLQTLNAVNPSMRVGLFPYPSTSGDAKLIFEPNITLMKSATTKYSDAIDKVFEVMTGDKALAQKIYDQTKTAPMLKGVTPSFKNPSQKDIDDYVAKGQIVDAGTGNNQLVWGGFQEENAKDIASWLQGKMTLDQALAAADSRKANSKP
jgi:ABC-type glycerol-3-phosphate transport system substrate-binding protein